MNLTLHRLRAEVWQHRGPFTTDTHDTCNWIHLETIDPGHSTTWALFRRWHTHIHTPTRARANTAIAFCVLERNWEDRKQKAKDNYGTTLAGTGRAWPCQWSCISNVTVGTAATGSHVRRTPGNSMGWLLRVVSYKRLIQVEFPNKIRDKTMVRILVIWLTVCLVICVLWVKPRTLWHCNSQKSVWLYGCTPFPDLPSCL